MRFHALLPVRDEADIIEQSLRQMLTWADSIYIFDTGSSDDTWDIINEVAAQDERVKPLRKDSVEFQNTLVRGWLFNEARREMEEGDWFLRVDADEFHHISPREFVSTRLMKHETAVWHQYYDFRLTASEVLAWMRGEESINDRTKPIEERRRWFIPSIYSEPRLCRYRGTMRWDASSSFPRNAGFIARARLPIRHYVHRDPPQMDKRSRIRGLAIAIRGGPYFTGYVPGDAARLRKAFVQSRDAAVGVAAHSHHRNVFEREWWRFIVPDNFPGLQYWKPGTTLPEVTYSNHLAIVPVRFCQRIAHAYLLSFLDQLRAKWPQGAYPNRLSVEEINFVRSELDHCRKGVVYPDCMQ